MSVGITIVGHCRENFIFCKEDTLIWDPWNLALSSAERPNPIILC